MSIPIKVGQSRVIEGLKMYVNGIENHHQYSAKVHANFRGITYIEYDNNGKKIYCKVVRGYDACPRDYPTFFVFLCSHFGLEKI